MDAISDYTYTIPEIKSIVAPIAKMHGVAKVCLFGSYARKEATKTSDVDLLIESGEIQTLVALGGFYADLEEGLQKKIDIITEDGMDKDFYNAIKKEEVTIYG